MTEYGEDSFRVADTDRERAAERLRLAQNEGRLTLMEYDERLRGVYGANTFGELRPLIADLPVPEVEQPKTSRPVERLKQRQGLIRKWRVWAMTSVILVGVWAISSPSPGDGGFWPAYAIGIWGLVLLARTLVGDQCGERSTESDPDK